MPTISTAEIKKLREKTGARVMDCKKALEKAGGDFKKAEELVREKGLERAAEKADRETKVGFVGSYVHATGMIAGLVELQCETDFVAQNQEFRKLANEIALHVTAMNPQDLAELLAQEFVRDPEVTIEQMIKELSGKIGEKMVLTRFVRYQVGK